MALSPESKKETVSVLSNSVQSPKKSCYYEKKKNEQLQYENFSQSTFFFYFK